MCGKMKSSEPVPAFILCFLLLSEWVVPVVCSLESVVSLGCISLKFGFEVGCSLKLSSHGSVWCPGWVTYAVHLICMSGTVEI